jgi:hypothetical protein
MTTAAAPVAASYGDLTTLTRDCTVVSYTRTLAGVTFLFRRVVSDEFMPNLCFFYFGIENVDLSSLHEKRLDEFYCGAFPCIASVFFECKSKQSNLLPCQGVKQGLDNPIRKSFRLIIVQGNNLGQPSS